MQMYFSTPGLTSAVPLKQLSIEIVISFNLIYHLGLFSYVFYLSIISDIISCEILQSDLFIPGLSVHTVNAILFFESYHIFQKRNKL